MLKLGVINVLNVLPVYHGILSDQIKVDCELVTGRVTMLNQKLNSGEIDISVISSFEYAKNPELYYVIPNLSISADGPVNSIYLFLDKPIEELGEDKIHLTEHSLTSVHLIQYLLKDLPVTYTKDQNEKVSGRVIIADDAIRRFYQKKDAFSYDLSELWRKKTGLPFAFAIWAVRKDSFNKNPEAVKNVAKALWKSKQIAGTQYLEMAQERYEGIFPAAEDCAWYLKNLRYDFSDKYQEGYLLFQQEMLKLGKINKITAPEFVPGL